MEAVGQLDHPNLVEAHDAGESDGIFYLVLKLIDGTNLQDLVRERGPLPAAEACELVRQAALGLQHLHEHGLVHRDIKPANLMRTPDGLVKVLDLGIARWQEVAPAGPELTETGQIVGTPDYMAPEQWDDARDVDIRADLYSLGCTLYHLLAGRPPFPSPGYDTNRAKREAHSRVRVPPIRERRPDVPDGLAMVLDRLLEKQPEDRFAFPSELAAALEPFTGGCDLFRLLIPAARVPPGLAEESGRFPASMPGQQAVCSSRFRSPWLAGVVVGIALLVVIVRSFLFVRPTTDPLPPLKGSIDLRAWDEHNRLRRDRRLDQEGVLPRKPGDLAQVEVRLNRPAYVYLIKIDTEGQTTPLYPWKENDWDQRPVDERPIALLNHPENPEDGLVAQEGGGGMETLVFLAREDPLPANVNLKALLTGISLRVVHFENAEVVYDGPGWAFVNSTTKIDDPVLRTKTLLMKLQPHCSYSRAISYPGPGK
jgi:hypothetical protein